MPEFDPITGRYAYLEVAGARNRVYFEEAGRAGRSCASTPQVPTHASGGTCFATQR